MIFEVQHFNKYDDTFGGELCLTCRIEDFVVLNFDLDDMFVLKRLKYRLITGGLF